ncbi:MAG TPA: SDR family NAD(P)-dependent oxidoreductase, partial [Candidatus Acidoferrales bacterium]|nr:SDR family NAD(P)-dependent oxidoreductase [Candidatus Acidoferrales bacterium]
TASIAGMIASPGTSVYNVSKFGVVALSESLHHELAMLGSSVRVSVLCPGFVSTNIMDSARNRPKELSDVPAKLPGADEMEQMARQLVAAGTPPRHVADVVFDAIRNERFYIFPHPEWKERIRARMEGVLEERNPELGSFEEILARLRGGS